MVGVELWWLGQAGFRLRDPALPTTVFVDPYLLKRETRTWQAPIEPAQLAIADLILTTHEHTDHLDRPSLKAAAEAPDSRFRLVVPRPLREQVIDELDIPPGRVVGAQPDEPFEYDDVKVHPVPARHGVNVDDAYTFGEQLSNGLARYLGYVVEIGGVRVYHAGDCVPYPGQADRLKALGPDVALLPINGRDFYRESERNTVGNMDEREAARLAHDMQAGLLIPMHWELFAHNRGFPGHLVAYVSDMYPELSVLVMGRGARLTYLPGA